MTIPTRRGRVEHAAKHCPMWNAADREAWAASRRTIETGALNIIDPVGTELKHGSDAAESKVE